MPSDPLLPLLDALLRLRNFNAAELDALLRQLPADSLNASAIPQQPVPQEPIPSEPVVAPPTASTLLNLTQNSAEPAEAPGELSPARETILVGFGENDSPLDPEVAAADEWSLLTEEKSLPAQSQAAKAAAESANAAAIPKQPAPQEPKPPQADVAPLAASTSLNTTLNFMPPVEPWEKSAPARETILVGFGEDDSPLDPAASDANEWSLPTEEESPAAQLQSDAQPAADSDEPELVFDPPARELPAPAEAGPSHFEWDGVSTTAAENKPVVREDLTDRRLRQIMAWSGKGLLVWVLFLGSFFFGAWFLRSAPQSQLAGKTKLSTEKSREQNTKRREIRSADGDPMLAKEELIAAEDAQIAMGLIGRDGAVREANMPNVHLDRNGLPQPDEGIVVFPNQQDFAPQPNIPPEGSRGPAPVVEAPPPSPPAAPVQAPLPIIIMPQGGGGFGPVAPPRGKSQVAQGGKNNPSSTVNAQSHPAAKSSQSATNPSLNPSHSGSNSNHHAHTSPPSGPTTPVSHVPPSRTPTPPAQGRSR